jgi:hypothetical protein
MHKYRDQLVSLAPSARQRLFRGEAECQLDEGVE